MTRTLAVFLVIVVGWAGCGKHADAPAPPRGSDQSAAGSAPAPAPAPTPPTPAAPAAAGKPSADQAIAAAKAWLAAVHDKDAGKLAAAVDFPYWQAGLALGKTGADTCQKRIAAATANDLAPIAKCLAEDTDLIDLIPSGGTTEEIAPNDVNDALKAYKQSLSDAESTHRFIQIELVQDFHMVLVIAVHQVNGKALVDFVVGELVG